MYVVVCCSVVDEFDDVDSRPVDVEVVEGNVAVIPCPGIPASRPSALIEFIHNGVKVTQSGQFNLITDTAACARRGFAAIH